MVDFDIRFSVSHSTDFQIERVGCCSLTSSPGLMNEYLESYALVFLLEGKMTVGINGKRSAMKRGDLLLLRPKTALAFDRGENVCYLYCVSDGNVFRDFFNDVSFVGRTVIPDELYATVRSFLSVTPENTFYYELKTLSLMADSLKLFSRKEERRVYKNYKNDFIDKFIVYVGENYMHDINVKSACKKIGISVNYFTARFTESVRLSPRQFIIEFRIDKALEMLANTELSVSEVAQYVGYSDAFSFSKAFKKKVGIAPTEYMRRQKARQFDPELAMGYKGDAMK